MNDEKPLVLLLVVFGLTLVCPRYCLRNTYTKTFIVYLNFKLNGHPVFNVATVLSGCGSSVSPCFSCCLPVIE